ncbi:uncharacterized protein [Oscarella lobularis]|uniref:uncharacterized protein n=1 Tax=Oscarella lobularis TaxID=121494 RepID=UPI003313F995
MEPIPGYYRRKEKRFVDKLWDLVENPDLDDAIRWSGDGAYVVVPSMTAFEERVLKVYFKTKHFSSFIRQLHMYGFHKRTQDVEVPTTGAYHFEHRLFVRGKAHQLVMVQRPPPKWRRSERVVEPVASAATTPTPLPATYHHHLHHHHQTALFQQAQLLHSFAASSSTSSSSSSAAVAAAARPVASIVRAASTELIRRGEIVYDYHPTTGGNETSSLINANRPPTLGINKENRMPRFVVGKTPALVLLAEICAAIRKMGQHPDTEEKRRQCIEIARMSIDSKRRESAAAACAQAITLAEPWIVHRVARLPPTTTVAAATMTAAATTTPVYASVPTTIKMDTATTDDDDADDDDDDESDEPSNLVIDVEK